MFVKKILGLVVGINQYKNIAHLSSATNDARDIAAVVRRGAVPSQVKVLLDGEATKEKILNELKALASCATARDTAIVFFSGHGFRRTAAADDRAYFCPVDASLDDLDRTCITNDEFTAALRATKSERLVAILDTCHAGAIGEPRNCRPLTTDLLERDLDSLVEGAGRVVLAASRPEEAAWELRGMRNGLFTSFVLRALRGDVARPDGSIWVSDVFSYVSRQVLAFGHQHTYQKHIGEDFVVMVQQRKMLAPTPFVLGDSLDQRMLRERMRSAYSRAELSLLCRDLGLNLEDLSDPALETQMMKLIDHCHRHGMYDQLLEHVQQNVTQSEH
jgi:hypothetical protein